MNAMMTKAEKLRIIGDDAAREFTLTKGGDTMAVKILDNGAFRCEVKGAISSVNHGNADTFLKEVQRFMGGLVKIVRGGDHHHHTHAHGHTHTH